MLALQRRMSHNSNGVEREPLWRPSLKVSLSSAFTRSRTATGNKIEVTIPGMPGAFTVCLKSTKGRLCESQLTSHQKGMFLNLKKQSKKVETGQLPLCMNYVFPAIRLQPAQCASWTGINGYVTALTSLFGDPETGGPSVISTSVLVPVPDSDSLNWR